LDQQVGKEGSKRGEQVRVCFLGRVYKKKESYRRGRKIVKK